MLLLIKGNLYIGLNHIILFIQATCWFNYNLLVLSNKIACKYCQIRVTLSFLSSLK